MVSLVIERPVNAEAITNMKNSLEAACRPSPQNSSTNDGPSAPYPAKALNGTNPQMGVVKETKNEESGANHQTHLNQNNIKEQRHRRSILWPSKCVDAFNNCHEKQLNQPNLRGFRSTK
ncbi:unnamed protein product, partial [Haemonchus placei]|uniref:Uncharacterized protein n=1 Tax=Haemonchus placei TaxID=6290 RepID=A0A0N4VZ61_HAEPC